MELQNYNKKNYEFKVCRVHNLIDLNKVINNGATMIGIHAVILDRAKYLLNEQIYKPLRTDFPFEEKLPIHTLEVDSIKFMQKYIPQNIKPVIIFQKELDVELIKKCCRIYNINQNQMCIQLHHRTNQQYIYSIKKEICNSIIVVVGIFQKDFSEYFWKVHCSLDPETDYILIDLSIHQSDLSEYDDKVCKIQKIKEIASMIKNNKVPIILADDTNIKKMKRYIKILKSENVLIKGIDIQNAVEISKKRQKYKFSYDVELQYQVKVRKSVKLLSKWKRFFKKNGKKYFS